MDSVPEKEKASEGAMAKAWMTAAGQNGIPTAFIVNKEGKIAWIGHPMEMEKPLEKIVAGTWDLKAVAGREAQGRRERGQDDESSVQARWPRFGRAIPRSW